MGQFLFRRDEGVLRLIVAVVLLTSVRSPNSVNFKLFRPAHPVTVKGSHPEHCRQPRTNPVLSDHFSLSAQSSKPSNPGAINEFWNRLHPIGHPKIQYLGTVVQRNLNPGLGRHTTNHCQCRIPCTHDLLLKANHPESVG
jgi:hypothetical protein